MKISRTNNPETAVCKKQYLKNLPDAGTVHHFRWPLLCHADCCQTTLFHATGNHPQSRSYLILRRSDPDVIPVHPRDFWQQGKVSQR